MCADAVYPQVLCCRLPVILFYGLPDVEMVGASEAQQHFTTSTKCPQAPVLYPICRRCSTSNDELLDRVYHILGIVRIPWILSVYLQK